MKEKLQMIKVETLSNGYSLKYEGMTNKNGFFYFTPSKLLEGFMLHIGLEMTQQLNPELMQDFIVAAINWKENEKCVKEIERLTTAMKILVVKRVSLAKRLITERNRHIALYNTIGTMLKESNNLERDLTKLLKDRTKVTPMTFYGLGITAEDLNNEPDDDEEVDDD